MVFNYNEAVGESKFANKTALPTRNPQLYIKYNWSKSDIAKFANESDTKKLKRLIGDPNDTDRDGDSEALNAGTKLWNAINKSNKSVVCVGKINGETLYYVTTSGTSISIEKKGSTVTSVNYGKQDVISVIKELIGE